MLCLRFAESQMSIYPDVLCRVSSLDNDNAIEPKMRRSERHATVTKDGFQTPAMLSATPTRLLDALGSSDRISVPIVAFVIIF